MNDKKELYGELAKLVKSAQEALDMAVKFANTHKLAFDWPATYGMGGWYNGIPNSVDPELEVGEAQNWAYASRNVNMGWQPSSGSC